MVRALLALLFCAVLAQPAAAQNFTDPGPGATAQQLAQAAADQAEINRIVSGLDLQPGETRTIVKRGDDPRQFVLATNAGSGWNHSFELQKGLTGGEIRTVLVLTPFGFMTQRIMHYKDRGELSRGDMVGIAARASQGMDYSDRGSNKPGYTQDGEPYVIPSDGIRGKLVTVTLLPDGQTLRMNGYLAVMPKRDYFCFNGVYNEVCIPSEITIPYPGRTVTVTKTVTRTWRDKPEAALAAPPAVPTAPPTVSVFVPPTVAAPGRETSLTGERRIRKVLDLNTLLVNGFYRCPGQPSTVCAPPNTTPILPPPGGGGEPPNNPTGPGPG